MSEVDLKPASSFSGQELERITEAVVEGFDLRELTLALRFKWGIVLANYVNTQQGFYGVVAELVSWTERRKKTLELIALAYAERPGNTDLQQLAEAYSLALPQAAQKYDLNSPLPAKPPSLEAMVAHHSRFIDYARFLNRFESLGDRVCRIETPYVIGTGFLVGPDLMLTNHHVIEDILEWPKQATHITCSFDGHQVSDGAERKKKPGKQKKKAIEYPIVSRLASEWLVANSPYAPRDIGQPGEPGVGELDYALLRLAEPIGEMPGRVTRERGWFSLTTERPLLAIRDFVVIPQHPGGDRLAVAWGNVLAFNTEATRVRYDAMTDGGSSGAPCMTADLDIFGLHHATDPAKKPKFNQAVPLNLIAADLKAKHIEIN